jgi:hypothetical protein
MSMALPLEAIAIEGQRAHGSPMIKRATQRPKDFVKPAHWTNDPAPQPAAPVAGEDPDGLSPTRNGDWVRKGIAVDF